MEEIIEEVKKELERQEQKWGHERNQHPAVWLTILTEEVGEVAQEICDSGFDAVNLPDNYKKELIQVAAVAISAAYGTKFYKDA